LGGVERRHKEGHAYLVVFLFQKIKAAAEPVGCVKEEKGAGGRMTNTLRVRDHQGEEGRVPPGPGVNGGGK